MVNGIVFYAANFLSNSPGAHFRPAGIRDGPHSLNLYGGYNVSMDVNPFSNWYKIPTMLILLLHRMTRNLPSTRINFVTKSLFIVRLLPRLASSLDSLPLELITLSPCLCYVPSTLLMGPFAWFICFSFWYLAQVLSWYQVWSIFYQIWSMILLCATLAFSVINSHCL